MKPIKSLTSACRYCRHFQPEGRRGGMCQKLSAPVQASWKACSLALPAFAPAWETLEDAWSLPVAQPISHSGGSLVAHGGNLKTGLAHSVTLDLDNFALAGVELTMPNVSEEVKTKTVVI